MTNCWHRPRSSSLPARSQMTRFVCHHFVSRSLFGAINLISFLSFSWSFSDPRLYQEIFGGQRGGPAYAVHTLSAHSCRCGGRGEENSRCFKVTCCCFEVSGESQCLICSFSCSPSDTVNISLATAHPAKFGEAVQRATGYQCYLLKFGFVSSSNTFSSM